MIGLQNLEKVLAALDRQIGIYGGSPLSLVVCGGAALAALELVDRTTKDVDVLARVDETKEGPEIRKINKFPPWLIEAANIVARDFGLPEDWLNLGPALQLESGLPDGFGDA